MLNEARIQRGFGVKNGEKPYQLLLIADDHLPNQQVSGATLIQDTWAMTAAHCVTVAPTKDLVDTIMVSGGSTNRRSTERQTQKFEAKDSVFAHPMWDWTLTSGYGK